MSMSRMSMSRFMLPVIAASLLAASPAFAQSPAAAPATTSAPAATHRDALVEKRITDLHSHLKITPAQQKPFDDFAAVMRENAADMDDLVGKRIQAAKTGSAVDQMQSYADMAKAHSDQMARLVPAFANLYAALSPQQKKTADESFRNFASKTRVMQRS